MSLPQARTLPPSVEPARIFHSRIKPGSGEGMGRLKRIEPNEDTTRRFFFERQGIALGLPRSTRASEKAVDKWRKNRAFGKNQNRTKQQQKKQHRCEPPFFAFTKKLKKLFN